MDEFSAFSGVPFRSVDIAVPEVAALMLSAFVC
jgi:hypothetical protein